MDGKLDVYSSILENTTMQCPPAGNIVNRPTRVNGKTTTTSSQ